MRPANDSTSAFARALVRSARADAPPLGAKARAAARLTDAMTRASILPRPIAGAVLAAVLFATLASGFAGRPLEGARLRAWMVRPDPECAAGIQAQAPADHGDDGSSSGAGGGPSGSSSG
jgi:hypothetical protein